MVLRTKPAKALIDRIADGGMNAGKVNAKVLLLPFAIVIGVGRGLNSYQAGAGCCAS